eukprot:31017-Pelagococcus_subviridis.AAC.13
MISAATVAKSKYLTVPSYGDISASAATHTSCERDRFTSCDSVTYARHALTSEKCSRPLPSGSAARNVSTSIFVIPSTLCSASFSSCLFFARSTRTSKHTGANSLYSINPSWFASASESSRFISLLFSPTFASLSALSNSVGSNAPLPSLFFPQALHEQQRDVLLHRALGFFAVSSRPRPRFQRADELDHEREELRVVHVSVLVRVRLRHDLPDLPLRQLQRGRPQHALELVPVQAAVPVLVVRHEHLQRELAQLADVHVPYRPPTQHLLHGRRRQRQLVRLLLARALEPRRDGALDPTAVVVVEQRSGVRVLAREARGEPREALAQEGEDEFRAERVHLVLHRGDDVAQGVMRGEGRLGGIRVDFALETKRDELRVQELLRELPSAFREEELQVRRVHRVVLDDGHDAARVARGRSRHCWRCGRGRPVVNEKIARGPAVQRDARHAMADAGDRHNADDVPDDDELLEPWQRVMRENARKAKVERFVELLRVRVDPDLSIARRRQISSSSALLSKYLSLSHRVVLLTSSSFCRPRRAIAGDLRTGRAHEPRRAREGHGREAQAEGGDETLERGGARERARRRRSARGGRAAAAAAVVRDPGDARSGGGAAGAAAATAAVVSERGREDVLRRQHRKHDPRHGQYGATASTHARTRTHTNRATKPPPSSGPKMVMSTNGLYAATSHAPAARFHQRESNMDSPGVMYSFGVISNIPNSAHDASSSIPTLNKNRKITMPAMDPTSSPFNSRALYDCMNAARSRFAVRSKRAA